MIDSKHTHKNSYNNTFDNKNNSFLLDDASPELTTPVNMNLELESNPIESTEINIQPISALALVQQAEYMYSGHHHEEAYRLARQAYSIDPYDWRGNLIYVATMVDLGLKNELFYLGKLVHIVIYCYWYMFIYFYTNEISNH